MDYAQLLSKLMTFYPEGQALQLEAKNELKVMAYHWQSRSFKEKPALAAYFNTKRGSLPVISLNHEGGSLIYAVCHTPELMAGQSPILPLIGVPLSSTISIAEVHDMNYGLQLVKPFDQFHEPSSQYFVDIQHNRLVMFKDADEFYHSKALQRYGVHYALADAAGQNRLAALEAATAPYLPAPDSTN